MFVKPKPKDFTKPASKPAGLQRTPISSDTIGFTDDERKMSGLDILSNEFKDYINDDVAKKQRFKIGVAVRPDQVKWQAQNESSGIELHGGHAFVSIEELPPPDENEPPFKVTFNDDKLINHSLVQDAGRKLYRAHIRRAKEEEKEALPEKERDWLRLYWEEPANPLIPLLVNYIPICEMTTTVRFLKQMALRSVNEGDHSVIVNDCATVTRYFFERFLEYLESERIIGSAERSEYKKMWLNRITIEDGSAGESEGSLRDSNRAARMS